MDAGWLSESGFDALVSRPELVHMLADSKKGSPERTLRGRSSLLIFQVALSVLSELAPARSTTGRPRERGLPGFVGPVPPPLWIRARESSVVVAAFWLAAANVARVYQT
jgi:hypothetical protein